jgi:hypothetical protein
MKKLFLTGLVATVLLSGLVAGCAQSRYDRDPYYGDRDYRSSTPATPGSAVRQGIREGVREGVADTVAP